jgi:lipopolysaccharide transport system ATP-binding protein
VTDLAIRAEGIGKAYRIDRASPERYRTVRDSIISTARRSLRRSFASPRETIWALRDVSFEVRQGETLGIIGRNGAGKSTLLKILSRITHPTTGRADLHGRLASLLEVGTGFHPELTGRENIYLNGAILGMRKPEIRRRFDEIVDFAETAQFLETPVKRYSSGMYMRLAFAVAAHLDSEILVVDEVLAVGDAEFQRKCLAKMDSLSRGGRCVVFVSHNLPAVENLCKTAILLERGAVSAAGSASEVVDTYLARTDAVGPTPIGQRHDRQGDGRVRFTAVDSTLRTGRSSALRLRYVAEPGVRNVAVSVGLFTDRGEGAAYLANELSGQTITELPETGTLTCEFDQAPFAPGRYTLNIYCTANGVLADWLIDAATVEVSEGDYFGSGRLPPAGYGSILVDHRWSVARH